MSEERTKRREEILWDKAKEIWKDWKVTISILWFLFIFITAFGAWGIFYWLSRNFSGEIDAAMINSLVAIFVTVPITLLTGAGTILVTVYFNLQTQKMAIQSQRSALRDKILEKRLEIYPNIEKMVERLYLKITLSKHKFERLEIDDGDVLREKISELKNYYEKNRIYISKKIYRYLGELTILALSTSRGRFKWKECESVIHQIKFLMREELDLEALETDWKFLQQYRIDEDFPSENES